MAGKKSISPVAEPEYWSAVARGRSTQLRAQAATYNAGTGRIEVELRNGSVFAFPPGLVQGLSGAPDDVLDAVEIYGAGTALHWTQLDVDYELSALMAGVFGTRTWMRELGRRGGRARSAAKARAARKNGMKGGRPRKSVGEQGGGVPGGMA